MCPRLSNALGMRLARNAKASMRPAQLQTHQQRQHSADDRHAHGGDQVLNADNFMIGAEDVLAPEPQLRVIVAVFAFVMMTVCFCHCI